MTTGDPFGLVGQVIDGQFRIDRFVGEGGFSIVYRGFHLGLEEPVAIKCLKLPSTLGSAIVENFVRRFRDESRLHYRLSQGHLQIVRSIASGTTMAPAMLALVPYMVLEWLDGKSLAEDFNQRRAAGKRGRTFSETIALLDPAIDAVAYAHAQGVVHRDMNPGNLYLADTRHGATLKVLDFGVAKIFSDHSLSMGPRAQTVGQIRIFSPAYGAPEQFDDRLGQVGPWSDVYALALVFLEALRDQCVMDGDHLGDFALKAIDPNRRPTPRALGLQVSDRVEDVFQHAVCVHPQQRFQDAGQFWGAIKAAALEHDELTRRRQLQPNVPTATGAAAPLVEYGQAANTTPTQHARQRTLMMSTPVPPPPGSETPASLDDPTVMAPRVHFPGQAASRGQAGPTHPAPPPEMEPSPKPVSALALLSQLRNADPASVKKIADATDDDEMTSIMLRESDFSVASVRAPVTQGSVTRDKHHAPSLASTPPDDMPPPPVPSVSPPTPQLGGGNVAQALQQAAHRATSSPDLPAPPRPAARPPPPRASQPQLPPFAPPMTSPSMVAAAPATNPNATAAMPASAPTKGPSRTLIMEPVPQEVQAMNHSPFAQSIPMTPEGFVPPQPTQQQPQQQPQQPQFSAPPALYANYAAAAPFAPMGQAPVQDPPEVPQSRGPLWVLLGILGLLILTGSVLFLTWAIRNRPGAHSDPQSSGLSSASATTSVSSATPPVPDGAVSAAPSATPPPSATPEPIKTESTTTPAPPTETANPPPRTSDPPSTPTTATAPAATESTFNAAAARRALGEKNAILASCKQHGVTGPGTIQVTFSTEGTVSGASIPGPPYAATSAGSCVISRFRTAKIAAFSGSPQTISYGFNVPK